MDISRQELNALKRIFDFLYNERFIGNLLKFDKEG